MNHKDEKATEVLEALRTYREADDAMNARARASSSMTDNEIRIIQFLLTAQRSRTDVTPTALSRHLGVTSASMTALLDRLERAGAIERTPHPSDRRSQLITATDLAERTVGAPVVAFQAATRQIATALTAQEQETVLTFLANLTEAMNQTSRTTAG